MELVANMALEETMLKARRRTLRATRQVGTMRSTIARLYFQCNMFALSRLLADVSKQTPVCLPEERDQIAECMDELTKLRGKLADLIAISTEKRLLGTRLSLRLERAATSLADIEEMWRAGLNNCFPELFDDIDQLINSIEPGVLPQMHPQTLSLASQALKESDSRKNVDIEAWARKLTADVAENTD